MAVFEYTAVDAGERAVGGTIVADTPRQARDRLRDSALTVTDVRAVGTSRSPWHRRRRRSTAETASFVRELATLLAAGIPLLSALGTLGRQHARRMRAAIQVLADRVSAGASLADAMAEQSEHFDDLCVSIVRVGESTGSLDAALRRLAEFLEGAHRLRSRLATAMVYPVIVSVVGIGVTVFLMTYVVPGLLEALQQTGRELPAITRVVKAGSDALLGGWWAILGVSGMLALVAGAFLRTTRGRWLADGWALRIPLAGPMVRKEVTARLAVVLAALLRSGLEFVPAVRIARATVRNVRVRRALEDYQAAVTAGKDVAGALEAGGVFAPMVIQMFAVGQQAGNLEEMLEQLASAYEQEVSVAAMRLTAALEPALIVALALVVGMVAMATVLPILEMSNAL